MSDRREVVNGWRTYHKAFKNFCCPPASASRPHGPLGRLLTFLSFKLTLTLRSSSGGSTLSLYWPFGRPTGGPEDPEKSVVNPPLGKELVNVSDDRM